MVTSVSTLVINLTDSTRVPDNKYCINGLLTITYVTDQLFIHSAAQ